MANPTSEADFTIPLATFLATAISDGDWGDVLDVEKVDEVGKLVPASQIKDAAGELWVNLIDDVVQKVWELNPGREDYQLDTVGAVTDTESLITLADGEFTDIKVRVMALTAANSERGFIDVEGQFYRDTTVKVLQLISSPVQVGLTGITANLVINSNDVELVVTGIAAKTIEWQARVEHVRRFTL